MITKGRRFSFLAAAVLSILQWSEAPARAGFVEIGVRFQGTSLATLSPSAVAGVDPQANFNNVQNGSGTVNSLVDQSGTATSASLTFSSSSGIYSGGIYPPAGGDETLNAGEITGNVSVTVANIPYKVYDIIVYTLNDSAGRIDATTLNGSQTYYGTSPDDRAPGYVDGDPSTSYIYTRATSTDSASPTPLADYVEFSGVTGASFTFNTSSPNGNGYVNGFQIVDVSSVPEPSSMVLVGLGVTAVLGHAWRRRSRAVA